MLLHDVLKDQKDSLYMKTKDAGADFKESEHPRESDGKFGSGGNNKEKASTGASASKLETIPMGKMNRKQAEDIYKQISNWPQGEKRGMALTAYGGSGHNDLHLVKVGKEIKAISTTSVEGDQLLVDRLSTKESGFGKKAMEDLFRLAAKNDHSIKIHSHEEAREFYRKMGMKETVVKGESYFSLSAEAVKRKANSVADSQFPSIESEYQGVPLIIENGANTVREGTDEQGNPWKTTFLYPYGFIQKTNGADGEEIDCFVGPNPYSSNVYVIHQNIGGQYDEDKVMFGFDSEEAARCAYLAHFDTQGHLGPITAMTLVEFKQWLATEAAEI